MKKMKNALNEFLLITVDCDYNEKILTRISYNLRLAIPNRKLMKGYHKTTQKWFYDDLIYRNDPVMFICRDRTDSTFNADVIIRKDQIETREDILGIAYTVCEMALDQDIPGSLTFKN